MPRYTPEEWEKVARGAYTVHGGDHMFSGQENESILGDIGSGLKIGGIQLGRQVAGALDYVTAGQASTAMNPWFDRQEQEIRDEYSPDTYRALAAYDRNVADATAQDGEVGGFLSSVTGLLSNPRAAAVKAAETAPSTIAGMVPGAIVARSTKAGMTLAGAAKAMAGKGAVKDAVTDTLTSEVKDKAVRNAAMWGSAAGEGVLGMGGSMNQLVAENNAAGRRPMEGSWAPVMTGLATAGTALAFGKLLPGANQEAALATAIAGGKMAKPVVTKAGKSQSLLGKTWGATKSLLKTGVEEGAEEGVQGVFETGFQNAALGKPITEGMGQNIGESATIGGMMGMGMHSATGAINKAADYFSKKPTDKDLSEVIDEADNNEQQPNDPRLQLAIRARELTTAFQNAKTPEEQQQILNELDTVQKQIEGLNLKQRGLKWFFSKGNTVNDQRPTLDASGRVAVGQAAAGMQMGGQAIPTAPVYASQDERDMAVQQRLAELNERLKNTQSREEAVAIQAEIESLTAPQQTGFPPTAPVYRSQPPTAPVYQSQNAQNTAAQRRMAELEAKLKNAKTEEEAADIRAEMAMLDVDQEVDAPTTQPTRAAMSAQSTQTAESTQPTQPQEDLNTEEGVLDAMKATREAYKVAKTPEEQEALITHYDELGKRLEAVRANTKEAPSPYADDDMSVEAITYRSQKRAKQNRLTDQREKHEKADAPFRAKAAEITAERSKAGTIKKVSNLFKRATSPDTFSGSTEGRKLDDAAASAFAAVDHPEKEAVAAAMDEAEAYGTPLGGPRAFKGNSIGLVNATTTVLKQAIEEKKSPKDVLNGKADTGIVASGKAVQRQARVYKRAALRLENPNDSDSDITKKVEDWESAVRKKQEKSAPKSEAKPKARGKKVDPVKTEQELIKKTGGFKDWPTPKQATVSAAQRRKYGDELVDSAIRAVKVGIKKGAAQVSEVTTKLIDRYTTAMNERKANGGKLSSLGMWIANDKRTELQGLADGIGVSITELALIGQVLPKGDAVFTKDGKIVQTTFLDQAKTKAETKPAQEASQATPPKSEVTPPKEEPKVAPKEPPPMVAFESDEDPNDLESNLSPIAFGTDYDYQREYGQAEKDAGAPKKFDPREQMERNRVRLEDKLFIARMLGGSPYAKKLSKGEQLALDALQKKRERAIKRSQKQIERLRKDYSKTAEERLRGINAITNELRAKAMEEDELNPGMPERGIQYTSGYRMATETPDIVRRCKETHDLIVQKIGLAMTRAGIGVEIDRPTGKYILPSDNPAALLKMLHDSGRLEVFKTKFNELQADILKEIVKHFRAVLNKNRSAANWATVGLDLSSSMLDTYAGAMQMIGANYEKTQIGRLLGALALANAGRHFSMKIDENAEEPTGVREITGRITMPVLSNASTDEEVRAEEEGIRKEIEGEAEERENAEYDEKKAKAEDTKLNKRTRKRVGEKKEAFLEPGEGKKKGDDETAEDEVDPEKAREIMERGMRAETVNLICHLKTDAQIENFFMNTVATDKEVDAADASIGESIIPKDLDGLSQEEWTKVGLEAEEQTNQEFFSTLPRSGRKLRPRTAEAFRQFVRRYVKGEFGSKGKKIVREGDFTSQLPEEVPPILIRTSLFPAILKPGEMRRWVRNIRKAVGVFKKDWKTGNIISYREKVPSPLGNEINVLAIVNNVLKDKAISDFYKTVVRNKKPMLGQAKYLPYINGLISVKRVIRYEMAIAIKRDIKRFAEAYRRNIAELMNLYEDPAEAWRTACQLQYDVEQVLDVLTDADGKKTGALPGLSPADRAKVDAQIKEIMHLAQVKLNVLDMANKPISTDHVKEKPPQLNNITFTTTLPRKKQKTITAEEYKKMQEESEQERAKRAVKDFNEGWHKEFLDRARETFPNTVAIAEARAAAGKADLMADAIEQYEKKMESLPDEETKGLAKEVSQYMDEFAKVAMPIAMDEKVGLNDTAYVNWVIESVLGTEENPNGFIVNKRINTADKARRRCENIQNGYIGRADRMSLSPLQQIKAMQYHYVAERLKSPLDPPDKAITSVQLWAEKTGKIEKSIYSSLRKSAAPKSRAKPAPKAEAKSTSKAKPKAEPKAEVEVKAAPAPRGEEAPAKKEAPAEVAEAPKPVETPKPVEAPKPVEKKVEPRYKEGKPATNEEKQKFLTEIAPSVAVTDQAKKANTFARDWAYGGFEKTDEGSFDEIRNSKADQRAIDAAVYIPMNKGEFNSVALPLDVAAEILRENDYASSSLVGVFSEGTAYTLAEGVKKFDQLGWQLPKGIFIADTIRTNIPLKTSADFRGAFHHKTNPKVETVIEGKSIKNGTPFKQTTYGGVISLGRRPLILNPNRESMKGILQADLEMTVGENTAFHEMLHAIIRENENQLSKAIGSVLKHLGDTETDFLAKLAKPIDSYRYDVLKILENTSDGAKLAEEYAKEHDLRRSIARQILARTAEHALDAYDNALRPLLRAQLHEMLEGTPVADTLGISAEDVDLYPCIAMGDEFFVSMYSFWLNDVAGMREECSKIEGWEKLAPIFEGVDKYVRSVKNTPYSGVQSKYSDDVTTNASPLGFSAQNEQHEHTSIRGNQTNGGGDSRTLAQTREQTGEQDLQSTGERGVSENGVRGSTDIHRDGANGTTGSTVDQGSAPISTEQGQRAEGSVLQRGSGKSSLPPQGNRSSSGEREASGRLDSVARDKIIESVPQRFKPLARTVLDSITDGAFRFMFSRNFVDEFKKILPSISKWWSGVEKLMQTRAQWQQKAADIADRFTKLNKHEQAAVNKVAIASTLNDFWPERDETIFTTQEAWDAYVDGIMSSDSAEDYKLFLKQYQSLSEEGRKILRDVLNVGTEEKRELTKIKIEDAHETILRQMRGATPQRKQELEDQLTREVNEINRDLQRAIRHPYVPLGRKGTHVVAYRSKEYLNTEKAIKDFQEKLRNANRAPTKAEEATLQDLKDKLDEMASDSKHYIVEFFEDRYDANKRYEDLKLQYPNLEKESIQVFDRAIFLGEQAPEWATSRKLLEQLTKEKEAENGTGSLREQDINRMADLLQELFVKALPDVSARKMQLRRRGVSGYNENAMENFIQHANASSHLIASLTHSQEIHDALQAMGDEAKQQATAGRRDEASIIANEVRRRQNQIFSGKAEGKTVGKIKRATSVWMLLTNPAFYLQNILQPGMMSAPYINGALGVNCLGELTNVMKRVAQFVTKDKSLQSLCATLSKNEREAIMRARDHQLLTIGITTDLGTVSNDSAYGRATNWLTQKAQTVEVVNRVSTHLVAYRNAIKKGMTHEEAMDFAEKVIVQTHGDYSKENAPSIMNENEFTQTAFQFRKFQFIQTGMVYRMLRDSARKDLSPAERAIARRQLMWIMATHFAAAGLKGTPVLAQIAALSAFIFGGAGDDDEDLIREAVGDKDVADFLLKGMPMLIGFDLSKKVGAGDMLNPLPFFEYDARKGKRNMGELMANAAGPWASVPAKMMEGVTYLANGEYSKGIEQILPYGLVSNLMKATRLQTEGYTNRTGDVLIQPENMAWVDWIYTGMGLTPTQMSRRTYLQGWALRHDAAFSEMKSDIQRDYDDAKRNHDYKGMAAAKKKLGELNRERIAAGYTPIKSTQLESTNKQKLKREKNAVGGVVTTNQNRAGLTRRSEW